MPAEVSRNFMMASFPISCMQSEGDQPGLCAGIGIKLAGKENWTALVSEALESFMDCDPNLPKGSAPQ